MTLKPPNYTQIPNAILDTMHLMSPAEFKVLMAICRRTFGWHRSQDVISLSQLERMTGLSRPAVQQALMVALDRGLLMRVEAGRQAFAYQLVLGGDSESGGPSSSDDGSELVNSVNQVVNSVNQLTELTSQDSCLAPVNSVNQQLVNSVYSQKKGLKKEINPSSSSAPHAREPLTQRRREEEEEEEEETRMTDDEGNSPDDSQAEEADTANVRADLIDGMVRLGVYRDSACQAVDRGTVQTDWHVILCKRYCERSPAKSPASMLWREYLSLGRLPPLPDDGRSTVTPEQRAMADAYTQESERINSAAPAFVPPRAARAAMDPARVKDFQHVASAPVVHAERRFQR